jgi:hypothetical protein
VKRRHHSLATAVLVQLAVVGAVIWSAFALPGCATLSDAVPTVTELAVLECRHWVDAHPEQHVPQSLCDNAGNLWLDVVTLIDAKTDVGAVKAALIAHPPLSAAAAASLALPCIDLKNPYEPPPAPADGPQSRLERRLYPPIVVASPHEGE